MRTWASLVGLNLVGALTGFLATCLIIWIFGLGVFADFAVDLARLSLLLLAIELLPSNFTLFRQQADARFAAAYPAFYAAGALLLPLAVAALIPIGAFDMPSWFMAPYMALAVIQRYFDCQLQARGELSDYLRIPAFANALRLSLLGTAISAGTVDLIRNPALVADLLWGSLALGLLLSLAIVSRRHFGLLADLTNAGRTESWHELWRLRSMYSAYYLNSILKRLKDTILPLACDAFLPKPMTGLVLAIYRAVDAAFGQLRLLESVFTNLAARARLRAKRSRIALLTAVVGQVGANVAAALLLWREGLDIATLGHAFLLSFAVYPYVGELLARSDALAAGDPQKVTNALIFYLLIFCLILAASNIFGHVSVTFIIIGLIIAQISSTLSYSLINIPLIGRR